MIHEKQDPRKEAEEELYKKILYILREYDSYSMRRDLAELCPSERLKMAASYYKVLTSLNK